MKKQNFLKLARKAHYIADSKKALEPLILGVRRLTTIADYFVIATAESAPQMQAITNTIYKEFNDNFGILPIHREGRDSAQWAVIDYGGLVVHIMGPATRKLYALEKIWKGARKIKTTVRR